MDCTLLTEYKDVFDLLKNKDYYRFIIVTPEDIDRWTEKKPNQMNQKNALEREDRDSET